MKSFLLKLSGVILAVGLIAASSIYYRMVELRNRVDERWNELEALIYKRAELIPKFTSETPLLSAEQSEAADRLVNAYITINSANTRATIATANHEIDSALFDFFAYAEQYDMSQIDPRFSRWLQKFSSLNRSILSASQDYNDAVECYNAAITEFPAYFIAQFAGFRTEPKVAVLEKSIEIQGDGEDKGEGQTERKTIQD